MGLIAGGFYLRTDAEKAARRAYISRRFRNVVVKGVPGRWKVEGEKR